MFYVCRSPLWLPVCILLLLFTDLQADTYTIGTHGKAQVIGHIAFTRSAYEETLLDIARKQGLGYDEIVKANPTISRWVPGESTRILLPKKHVLPDAPHEGIVLNVSELRLYYFPAKRESGERIVKTYPVSTGRIDWKTPLGTTRIIRKDKNPPWYPPESIKEEHRESGTPLPDIVPGGPDNPLGSFALRLGLPTYLIHGTNDPRGIGMRVTHGCVRMYPEDIEYLYNVVPVGTAVHIVDQPIKVGWRGNDLYLEVHGALDPEEQFEKPTLEGALELINKHYIEGMKLDREVVKRAVRVASGIPVAIAEIGNDAEGYFFDPNL